MPIKPENKGRYPDDWKAIRAGILARAGQRSYTSATYQKTVIEEEALCECNGECGADHRRHGHFDINFRPVYPNVCRAPNHTIIHRANDTPGMWFEEERMTEHGDLLTRPVKIVLTIAHLDHMPEHNDPSNLRAFCQMCHLRYDAEHHSKTRGETRLKRQPVLPFVEVS